MIDENYSSFTKTGPNKANNKPDEPEIIEKREKREREREREKKRLATVLSFYSVNFGVPKVTQRPLLRATRFS